MPRRPALDRDVAVDRALDSLRADDLDEVLQAMAALHVPHKQYPAEVLIELAADALEVAGVSRRDPISAGDLWERYVPEVEIRGNTAHQKSAYVLRAVAMTHGGVRPDLFADAGWWRAGDLWSWATLVFVLYARAAADRLGRPIADVCDMLSSRRATDAS